MLNQCGMFECADWYGKYAFNVYMVIINIMIALCGVRVEGLANRS